MAIEKYIKCDDIFDPVPSYLGIWFFSNNNLIKNAKKENGTNLFIEYYKKEIYEPLKQYFKSLDYLKLNMGFMSSANDNLMGRKLSPSKVDFFLALIRFLSNNLDKYGKNEADFEEYLIKLADNISLDNETLNNAFGNALAEKAKKLQTLIEDEFNSEYFEIAMKDYEIYKLYTNDQIPFSTYINRTYTLTKDLQVGLRTLGDFFDQSLNTQKLFACFDPDTFYLLFAITIYEYNSLSEKETGILDNSFSYLYNYFNSIEEVIKDDKKYNPTVLYTWRDGKKEKVSRRGLQIKYDELKSRHPEVKPFILPKSDNNDKYKDITLIEKLKTLYTGEAKLNWEFLPEGEKIKKSDSKEIKENNSPNKDKEKLLQEVNTRITILENSGYLGRPIRGLNTFSGYYAFVYANGIVILEKFWDNEETLNPAAYNATYVMNIDNFMEMSRIPKLNLIEYMKTFPEIGVKRIFHTSIENWQRNLYKVINGSYRLEEAINFISSLQNGELENEQ